jgi:hypothetical protein
MAGKDFEYSLAGEKWLRGREYPGLVKYMKK